MKYALKFLSLFVLIFAGLAGSAFAADATDLTAAPAATSIVSLLSSGSTWMALITLVSTLIAIWKHNAANSAGVHLTTAQKINQSLILGIETAGQIPEAVAAVDKVKAVVQAKATEYGVQPVLHALVETFTTPAATATAAAK